MVRPIPLRDPLRGLTEFEERNQPHRSRRQSQRREDARLTESGTAV
jgi:hypothetical protein